MSQTLVSIEVYYDHGAELKRYALKNVTMKKLKEFRDTIISAGLMLPTAVDEWIIVLPNNIRSVVVTRQKQFFRDTNLQTYANDKTG
jgi:hypothetical protein